MSSEEVYFCPNCMAKISSEDAVCPECGGSMNIQNSPHQLPVNSILNGRYLIGRVLGEGGFGITYLGYDLRTNTKTAIKEYFPSSRTASARSPTQCLFMTKRVCLSMKRANSAFLRKRKPYIASETRKISSTCLISFPRTTPRISSWNI